MASNPLRYIAHYPDHLQQQVRGLIARDELGAWLGQRYAPPPSLHTHESLYARVKLLKQRYLSTITMPNQVCFDGQLERAWQALGINRIVTHVHGQKLKTRREIRIATVFKSAPDPLLQTIVVHEVAHLKERNHDKAFYQLCQHMLPDYHQLEFDARLWLIAQDLRVSKV